MWKSIATFLLEVPPIDEIGGKINHIIEQYRAGILKKELAINCIIQNHKKFLENYVETNKLLNE